jgi:hypothetical protein
VLQIHYRADVREAFRCVLAGGRETELATRLFCINSKPQDESPTDRARTMPSGSCCHAIDSFQKVGPSSDESLWDDCTSSPHSFPQGTRLGHKIVDPCCAILSIRR